MMPKRWKPSPSMVVALAALFISLGGTTIAARHYLITSTSQIKPSVLRSLRTAGPRGAPGPSGPVGPQGPTGGEAAVVPLREKLNEVRAKLNEDTKQLDGICSAVGIESIITAGEATKLAGFVTELDSNGCAGYLDIGVF
jgi:hypothetical protein